MPFEHLESSCHTLSVQPIPEGASETRGRGCGVSILGMLIAVNVCVLVLLLTPTGCRLSAQGSTPACKSNLKNIGTAMEMYSIDWNGKYPAGGKSQLTPNYLKTIPECPAAGTDTYRMALGPSAPYNTKSYEDYYFIECQGRSHVPFDIPQNYPQYTCLVGLIER